MNKNLEEMDFEFLKELRTSQYNILIGLQLINDASKAEQVTKLDKFVDKIDAEIKRRKAEDDKKKVDVAKEVKTESFAKDYTSHKIKTMSHVIVTEVPVFSSGHDVHVWLNKLESYHKLYVANDNSGIMEEHFIQTAKSRLCPEYLHSMLSTSDSTDTFEQMKCYMKKNHASKMSVFQILDTLWEMEQKESESFRDLGLRLDDKATEAENIIEAKFKEWAEANSETSEMSKSDIYKVVSGQVFLQILKAKHRVIYNNICNDLDKTWSAKDIALKAMTYSDRMEKSEDSRNQGTVPDAFAAQRGNISKPKKSKSKDSRNKSRPDKDQDCYSFILTGSCVHGNQCKRKHSQDRRKAFEEATRRENNGDKGDSKPQGGNNDKKANNANQGKSHHASYAAVVGDVPIIPLPTQNFRN